MRNKAPIFINGFQRGGTNLLFNLIGSHPQVVLLNSETHEVFYGRNYEPVKKWLHRALYLPILIGTRQHTFWPYRLYERRPLSKFLMRYADMLLYTNREKEGEMPVKGGQDPHLLCKNVNAVALTSHILAEMYPQAAFIGLVRNGLALCEGFMRRGWPPEKFGAFYTTICERMIRDAEQMPHYHLVTFEEMIADPLSFIRKVYVLLGLDANLVTRLRLQSRRSMNKTGKHEYTFGSRDRQVHWFAIDEVEQQIRKDVNENQIARLSEADKEAFLSEARDTMQKLGYLDSARKATSEV